MKYLVVKGLREGEKDTLIIYQASTLTSHDKKLIYLRSDSHMYNCTIGETLQSEISYDPRMWKYDLYDSKEKMFEEYFIDML